MSIFWNFPQIHLYIMTFMLSRLYSVDSFLESSHHPASSAVDTVRSRGQTSTIAGTVAHHGHISPRQSGFQAISAAKLDGARCRVDSLESAAAAKEHTRTLSSWPAFGGVWAPPHLFERSYNHLPLIQRWIRSLEWRAKKSAYLKTPVSDSMPRWCCAENDGQPLRVAPPWAAKKAHSSSPTQFVSMGGSASTGQAGNSIWTQPWSEVSQPICDSQLSCKIEPLQTQPTSFGDSKLGSQMTASAVERSLKRRQILEELIRTEQGYICDLRFLVHVGVL